MRSPVIAFSILAAAAVSPSLVAGAPTSPNPDAAHSPRQLSNAVMNHLDAPGLPIQPPVQPPVSVPQGASKALDAPGPLSGVLGGSSSDSQDKKKPDPAAHRQAEQQLHDPSSSSIDAYTSHTKRASDMNSAGGNSYTGAASDTSGGSVVSVAHGGAAAGDAATGVTNDGGSTYQSDTTIGCHAYYPL